MTKFLLSLFFCLFSTLALAAGPFYVGTSGNDGNDCLSSASPCATLQHVVDLCPLVNTCVVFVADGTYHQTAKVYYWKLVSFIGNCNSRGAVIIDDGGIATALFVGQDHAILMLSCMTLVGTVNGSTGVLSRQYTIADVDRINFGGFPAGNAVSLTENSKATVTNPQISGAYSSFAAAADGSQLTVGGDVVLNGNPTFSNAFVAGLFFAILNFYPSSLTGTSASHSFQCFDSIVKNSGAIPGSAGAVPGNDNCKLR